MPLDRLLVVRRGRCARSREGRVLHVVVAPGGDGQRVTASRRAHPRSPAAARSEGVAEHALDRRSRIRVFAVRQVVPIRERHGGNDRRVHVGGGARHERPLVAEVAVRRVVGRIGDHLTQGRRTGPRIEDGTRVVHAREGHLRHVAGRVRRIDAVGGEVQTVEEAPLVRIGARHLVAAEVAHCDRQVGRAELLAELRRERVEFGGEVVGDGAGEVAGDMRRAEDVELGQHRGLVVQDHFLAVAQIARRTCERRGLPGARVQAVQVGDDALLAHTRPERLDAARVAFVARRCAEVGGQVQAAGTVLVVVGIDRGLVGHDEDVAESGELLRHRRDVDVAEEDVLVLFLHQLVACRDDELHHVLAGRQHLGAVAGRVIHADRGVAIGTGWLAGGRADSRHAREPVHPVVGRRLDLVQHRPAVVALEQRMVRKRRLRTRRVEPLLAVLQCREERAGGVLPGAVHVGNLRHAVGGKVEALRPVVPARRRRGVDQLQALGAVLGVDSLLVQVDLHARHARLPAQLQQERRIVERTRRGVDHLAGDAAVLAGVELLHAEFDEAVLAEQALPALGVSPGLRGIDAAGGKTRAGLDAGRRVGGAGTGRVARASRDGRVCAVGIGAIDRAGNPLVERERHLLDRVREVVRDGGARSARRAVRGTARVIDDVRPCRLEARGGGFDHQPVHEREHFVEARVPVQIRVVEEADAAVAIADVGVDQREAGLLTLRDAVAIRVDERAGIDVRPPLRGGEQLGCGVAVDPDRLHEAVDDELVPLVEDGELPVALGNIRKGDLSVRIALAEGEVRGIRSAQGQVALREAVGSVGRRIRRSSAAAVDALVGRAAHARARDLHVEGGVAGEAAPRRRRVADARTRAVVAPIVDDLRVGEADGDVVAARTEFLEVGWLVGLDERLVRLGAVQGVGLQPLLAAGDAVGRGRGHDFVQARIEVGDDRLAGERRPGDAVGLELRAGRDHSHQSVGPLRDRTGIQSGDGIDGPRQGIGHRLVELVVGELPGRIAESPRLVEELELEPAQSGLVGREGRTGAAADVLFAVHRVVVLEHQHRDLGRRQRGLLQPDVDCRLAGGDRRAAHGVAAEGRVVAVGIAEIARLPPRVGRVVGAAVLGDVELPQGAVGGVRVAIRVDLHRAARAADGRVHAVAGQDREVVALRGIEVDAVRIHRNLLARGGIDDDADAGGVGRRAARAVADVARRRSALHRLPALARGRADAALRHHRHAGDVEAVAQALHRQRRAGARPDARVGRVDLALGIHRERPVFLDDPAVVRDQHTVQRVAHVDRHVRRWQEDHGGVCRTRRGARRPLRIPGLVAEGHAGRPDWRGRKCRTGHAGATLVRNE